MSSLNKRTKQTRTLYAEARRKQDRLDQEKQLRADVEQELIQYFQEKIWNKKGILNPSIQQFMSLLNAKLQAWPGKNMRMNFFGHISSKSI